MPLSRNFLRFTLLLSLVLCPVGPVAAGEPLRLVTEEWPGLVDDAPDGPKGVLWEIASEVLSAMGHEVTLEFVPWKRALQMVELGKRDGILGIGLDPERRKIYRYPDQHLIHSETIVVSRSDDDFVFEAMVSLTGLSVGVSPGYSYSSEVREAENFTRVSIPSIESGLAMLLLGRIDAMLANRDVVISEAGRLNILDQLMLAEKAISGGPLYLAFRPGMDPGLVRQFSEQLDKKHSSTH